MGEKSLVFSGGASASFLALEQETSGGRHEVLKREADKEVDILLGTGRCRRQRPSSRG